MPQKTFDGLSGKFISATLDNLPKKDLDEELMQFLIDSPEVLKKRLRGILPKPDSREKKYCLEQVFKDEIDFVDQCNGKETPFSMQNLLAYEMDPYFLKPEVNVFGKPTKKTRIECYKQIRDYELAGMFNSFGAQLKDLCFTYHQIKKIVRKYRKFFPGQSVVRFLVQHESKGNMPKIIYLGHCLAGFQLAESNWTDEAYERVWIDRPSYFIIPKQF
jgi:hypothetical protein